MFTSAGNITDEVPALDEVGLFALQPDDALIRSLLELLLLVKTFLRLLREKQQEEGRGGRE